MKALVEVLFEENEQGIFFKPYGIFGKKIRIDKDERDKLRLFQRRYYLAFFVTLLLSTLFSGILLVIFSPVFLFFYRRKMKKYNAFEIKNIILKLKESVHRTAEVYNYLLIFSLCILFFLFASISLFLILLEEELVASVILAFLSVLGLTFFSFVLFEKLRIKKN